MSYTICISTVVLYASYIFTLAHVHTCTKTIMCWNRRVHAYVNIGGNIPHVLVTDLIRTSCASCTVNKRMKWTRAENDNAQFDKVSHMQTHRKLVRQPLEKIRWEWLLVLCNAPPSLHPAPLVNFSCSSKTFSSVIYSSQTGLEWLNMCVSKPNSIATFILCTTCTHLPRP